MIDFPPFSETRMSLRPSKSTGLTSRDSQPWKDRSKQQELTFSSSLFGSNCSVSLIVISLLLVTVTISLYMFPDGHFWSSFYSKSELERYQQVDSIVENRNDVSMTNLVETNAEETKVDSLQFPSYASSKDFSHREVSATRQDVSEGSYGQKHNILPHDSSQEDSSTFSTKDSFSNPKKIPTSPKALELDPPLGKVIQDYIEEFVREDSISPKRLQMSLQIKEFNTKAVYVKIRSGKASYIYDFDDSKHSRMKSFKQQISALEAKYGTQLPDVDFVVQLHDGNKPPGGATHFGSAKHWKDWSVIPVPIGNSRGKKEGFGTEFQDWDQYMSSVVLDSHKNYSWDSKIQKAFFRGGLAMQTHTLGSCNARRCTKARSWKEVNRGIMYMKAQSQPDIFDIEFTSKGNFKPGIIDDVPVNASARISFVDSQKYKYILNVGSNQDWAERLRGHLFMNSAILRHEAETLEWFYPFLKPYVHYIPIKLDLSDIVEQVQWAINHDEEVQQLVANANAFAVKYISKDFMCQYWLEVLKQYAKVQQLDK